jgi:DNA (cytosine-5)-methyltransferase 1
MRFASVCSGIEAASVAWKPLGWKAAFVSEIEKFPSAVLAHHYPDVSNLGDMNRFKDWPDAAFDLLVGGTPCQSFSVAGLRKGLADPRGNLALVYLAIAARYRPRWLVWENVPGVLSSDGGRDFGAFLGGLGELGYGFAYRVLDAQYVRVDGLERGVPQRRRRVFVVGHLGDWRRAAAVLFERESLSWDSPPRREARERVAPTIAARTRGGGGLGTDFDCDGGLIAASTGDISHCLNAGGMGRIDYETETLVSHSLRADGFDASEDGTGRGTPLVAHETGQGWWKQDNVSGTLRAEGEDRPSRPSHAIASPVAFSCKDHGADAGETAPTLRAMGHDGSHPNAGGQVAVMTLAIRGRGDGHNLETRQDGTANAILTPNGGRAGIGVGAIAQGWAVRRLTPLECERLQGFPDGYTAIPYRGKPAADGPRYKALGNSMAVNVMRWIGQRIDLVESTLSQLAA